MEKFEPDKYTYYDSIGSVYRVSGENTEVYTGGGKWEKTDRDINHDYLYDLHDTGKIENDDFFRYLIEEWDSEE